MTSRHDDFPPGKVVEFDVNSLPARLDEAMQRLRDLGIDRGRGRYHDYLRDLKSIPSQYLPRTVFGTLSRKGKTRFALSISEAQRLVFILSQLSDDEIRSYAEDFRILLEGPLKEEDERTATSSNRARNRVFPLFALSFLKNKGLEVAAPQHREDLLLRFGGSTFVVEAKRPFSVGAGIRAVEEAAEQISERMTHYDHPLCVGIIFISLGRSLSEGKYFIHAKDNDELRAKLLDLDRDIKRDWDWGRLTLKKRVSAMIFCMDTLATVYAEHMVVMTWHMNFQKSPFLDVGARMALDVLWRHIGTARDVLPRASFSRGAV